MRPSNQKSVLALIYKQMDVLDERKTEYLEDDIQKLDALIRASRMTVELHVEERMRVKSVIEAAEARKNGVDVELRQIESKGFDDTTHIKE